MKNIVPKFTDINLSTPQFVTFKSKYLGIFRIGFIYNIFHKNPFSFSNADKNLKIEVISTCNTYRSWI